VDSSNRTWIVLDSRDDPRSSTRLVPRGGAFGTARVDQRADTRRSGFWNRSDDRRSANLPRRRSFR